VRYFWFAVGVLLACAVVALLTACGNELSEGTVVSKEDRPAHYENYLAQQYAGQDCHYSNATRAETCEPRYIWVERQRFVSEQWVLHLKSCHVNQEGNEKCRKGVAHVSQDVYNSTIVGDHYQKT
jgi:outer membrane lipopolysaccharide assembly protein LptE/RlpB